MNGSFHHRGKEAGDIALALNSQDSHINDSANSAQILTLLFVLAWGAWDFDAASSSKRRDFLF